MGIFSSKKKHYVDTSIVRLVADEDVPSVQLAALVRGIFKGSRLSDSVLDHALNGNHRNFERMYRWADTPGNYFYGLPDQVLLTSSDGAVAAKAAIEADIGEVVTIEYYHFRPLNNIHAGWQHLTENLAYNETTNEIVTLSASVGYTVYLDKMVAVHASAAGQELEQSSVSQWGQSPSSGVTPDRLAWANPSELADLVTTHEYRVGSGETESVEIHYTWKDGGGIVQNDSVVLDLSSYDTDQEYHQAKYTYSGGQIGYWIYDPLTGGHTALNEIFGPVYDYEAPGTYFPFVIFRREGVNRGDIAYRNTQEYLTSVELLRKINLDYEELSDAINDDADIDDVDQAVMMMAVPITSENQTELEYLHAFFSRLHDQSPDAATQPHYANDTSLSSKYGTNGGAVESFAIDIQDADFRMSISFDAITKRLKSGQIGAVGEHTNSTSVLTPVNLTFLHGIVPVGVSSSNARIFQKQLTAHVYEEIVVTAPKVRYHIYADLGAEAGIDDDRMMIPIDYDLAKEMKFIKREELYYRSLHFVFNSHVVQTVKWYQREAFGVLLTIVAVVLAFYIGPWAGKTMAALKVGGITAAAMVLAEFIISQIILDAIFKVVFTAVVDAIGAEEAVWLAAVLIATGVLKGMKVISAVSSATAANFFQVANGLLAGAGRAFATEIRDLEKAYTDYTLLAEELQEELERGQDLLGETVDLNPFVFVGREPLLVNGETPTDYFSRTIHSGDPGVNTLNIVQNFVSISLTLPTIDETIGNRRNGST
jgi:hypothetical protein